MSLKKIDLSYVALDSGWVNKNEKRTIVRKLHKTLTKSLRKKESVKRKGENEKNTMIIQKINIHPIIIYNDRTVWNYPLFSFNY